MGGLSIVVPAYDEEGSLATVVSSLSEILTQANVGEFEILIVNDGSRDATPQIAESLARGDSRIRVLHHTLNRGYGGALRTGYANAKLAWVTSLPSDGEVSPRHLIALWRSGDDADVVVSARVRQSGTMPLYRSVLTAGWRTLMRLLLGVSQEGREGCYIFRRSLIDSTRLHSDSGVLHMEILIRCQMAGARVVQGPPMVVQPRISGQSKVSNLITVVRHVREMLKLRWLLFYERRRGLARRAVVAAASDECRRDA